MSIKNKYEAAYALLLVKILDEGHVHNARNGNTRRLFNQQLTVDLQEGFPLLTGRKMPWAGILGETLSFIRGYTRLEDINALGCHFWDKNCAEQGRTDIGPAYGNLWRGFTSTYQEASKEPNVYTCDQLKMVIAQLIVQPQSRQIVMTNLNPALTPFQVLPPCHCMAQWMVTGALSEDKPSLHCTVTMRSADLFVGVPADIALYALLTELLAYAVGMVPGTLCVNMTDCHVYSLNESQAREYLSRDTFPLPELAISREYSKLLFGVVNNKQLRDLLNQDTLSNAVEHIVSWLEGLDPADIGFEKYQACSSIRVTMVA